MSLEDMELPGMWSTADYMGGETDVYSIVIDSTGKEIRIENPPPTPDPDSMTIREEYLAAKRYGEWMQLARKRRGWTQAELASRLGTTLNNISRVETGRKYPHPDEAKKIYRELSTGE